MNTSESFISITNRKDILVRGVNDILEYDSQKIVLSIGDSELIISGENFNVKKIDTDNKIAEISGVMYSMNFSDAENRSDKTFFRKLFR